MSLKRLTEQDQKSETGPDKEKPKPEPVKKDPNEVVFVEFRTFVGKKRKRKKVERMAVTSAELSEMLAKDNTASAQLSLFG